MQVVYRKACLAPYAEHMRDRSMFQREFCRRLGDEPALDGQVLDIGCGPDLPEPLESLRPRLANLDGIDPSPQVNSHPLLNRRWQSEFETADIPESHYDLAYAYNVVEHIREPGPFFAKLRRVLKPGGVFWALTPHARHPFCWCVRLVQTLRLRRHAAAMNAGVNDYPAWYRLNSVKAVRRSAGKHGFEKGEFVHIPCMQWDTYFPRFARALPHLYDRLLGLRHGGSMLLLAYRLQ